MFKFIRELLKSFKTLSMADIIALITGDTFVNFVTDLQQTHTPKANKFAVSQAVNIIKKETLQYCKDRGVNPENLTEDHKEEFIRCLKLRLSTEKALALKGKEATNYQLDRQAKYFNNMFEWHFYLAISDILQDRHDELDPIIGDQACEMRCPFILDMATLIHQLAIQYCNNDQEAYNNLLSLCIEVDSTVGGHRNDLEVTPKILKQKLLHVPEEFKNFCAFCREALITVVGPTNDEFFGRNIIIKDEEVCPWKAFSISTNETSHLPWVDLPNGFRADWYLVLCKSFTRNRDALTDCLGIDIDHQSDNNFFNIGRFDKKYEILFTGGDETEIVKLRRNLTNSSNKIVDGFKQYLAHASVGYMRYCARLLAEKYEDSLFQEAYEVLCASDALISLSGFCVNVLPVFDAFRVVLGHAAANGHPIVVNLTRVILRTGLDEYGDTLQSYDCIGNWVLYYEPGDDGRFQYVNLTDNEMDGRRKKPAIAVVAASIYNPDRPAPNEYGFMNEEDPNVFIQGLLQCDIAHLLMWFALNHPVFPASAQIPTALNLPVENPQSESPFGKPANLNNVPDMGRYYARQGIYVQALNAPPEPYTFDQTSITAPLFNLLPPHGEGASSAREFDYYCQLTHDLGLEVESVKYALMVGRREDEAPWVRNEATLFFVATHMYVTTFDTEDHHVSLVSPTGYNNIAKELRNDELRKKSDIYHDHTTTDVSSDE